MTETFLLGGYTRRINTGLKSVTLEKDDELFSAHKSIASLNNPTYLCLSNDLNYLFAIHQDDPKSGLVAFKKNDQDKWYEVDRLMVSNIPGCHLSYRASSRTIYLSNYHEGALDIFYFDEHEYLHHIQRVEHTGSSVHPNQTKPHIHYAGVSHDQRRLYVCDLGTDTVSTYEIDYEGKITLEHSLELPAGCGPRHLVKHPKSNFVYIIGELDNTTTLAYLNTDGSLTIKDRKQNIPDQFIEESSGAAIRLSQDGLFLYVSTRYHNSITVYEINQKNGHLTRIQRINTVGKVPRDFILDQDEKYLIVAHQDSDYLSLFKRDKKSGELSFIHNETYAPECVCILSESSTTLN
ncbi:lactonase family protein [Facklamia lactis]|uniref:lactonase family protein n=1 Tax=Facklamia lactis TaxID=2749967 RepID=UPI0018CF0827|nr:lactonase family protein [Facklamia lactis]MBG9980177.1 lactonase family protein [Facklamia lactis]